MPLKIVRKTKDFNEEDYDCYVKEGQKDKETQNILLKSSRARLLSAENGKCKIEAYTPTWKGGDKGEKDKIFACYKDSLKIAIKNKCETVAINLIGTEKDDFPKEKLLKYAVKAIGMFLFENEISVTLAVPDDDNYKGEDFPNVKEYLENSTRQMPESDEEEKYIENSNRDFTDMLFDLIDKSTMTDVECYKRANIEKKTFNKIKTNPDYRPSKRKAVAFAIALQLKYDEIQSLLATLNYTLSTSNDFDMIIMYFLSNKNYDVYEINRALFEFDQKLLG